MWELKPFGKGYELDYKFITNGKTYHEIKDLWVYDLKSERWICFSLESNGNYKIFYGVFTSNNKLLWYSFEVFNPEKILERFREDFITPDVFILNYIIEGKVSKAWTFYRIKS